jgi:phage terminase large subunit GpA-like protein
MLTAETHPSAKAAWRARRREVVRAVLAPRPRLSVSEWAEQTIYLPSENSAIAGRLRYDQTPYLREIVDFLSDVEGEEGVVLKSAQIGFTVGVLVTAMCYFIDQDPSPILLMQPTLDDAERFSKKKLMPIIRASPALRKKVAEARPGDAANTILQKSGAGWSASMVGAKSPRQMRSDSIRVFLSDERSGYSTSAGVEGNPYLLGVARTLSFDNRKLLTGSTPVISPDETEKDYQDSDRRQWYVPCPECGAEQPLRWENLRWDKEGGGDTGLPRVHKPETAHFVCEVNGCVIEERHKRKMVRAGRFVAENAGHKKRGWKVWQGYSLMPKAKWPIIVADWLKAQGDPEKLKIFFNTVLAQSYEERGERPDVDALSARREAYAAPVPMRVAVLTAAVDVQGDRVELLIKGWGAGEESWQIGHWRIKGDPKQKGPGSVWETLDRLLLAPYRHESGIDLYVRACAVDTSDQTDLCYDYVKPRQRRGVIAVKGEEAIGKQILIKQGRAKTPGVKLWKVGTHTAKSRVFSRLRIEPTNDGTPKPGAIHFPFPQADGLDDAYLKQFENEKAVAKKLPNGRIVHVFRKTSGQPNEALDLEVYALTALHWLGDGVRNFLGQIAEQLHAKAGTLPQSVASERKALPTLATAPAPPATTAKFRGRRMRSRGVP